MRVRRGLLRVPEITVYFWVVKAMSTAMGGATSDYLVRVLGPVPAVLLGFVAFVVAMVIQLTRGRYLAWSYWLAVVMVGVFGTMAADVMHVGFGVPYIASSIFYGVSLAMIFIAWYWMEGTLSIHSIASIRPELFYWATVVATFALGTALGDLTAITFGLGYMGSAVLFAAVMLLPAIGFWRLRLNPILTFWFAYVDTRPLGASLADWTGKARSFGGLGWGEGRVAVLLSLAIAALVAYLSWTRCDVLQAFPGEAAASPGADRQRVPRGA